jgi:hypothetical protein
MYSELLINSVWEFAEVENSKFRIIEIYSESNECIVFPIDIDRKKICKPEIKSIDEIIYLIEKDQIFESTLEIPGIMQENENELDKKLISIRNQRYDSIKKLVTDNKLVYEFSKSNRSKLISKHARENGFVLQTLYRCLKDYWRYGQTINGLIPLRDAQGGANKDRSSGDVKRGRPNKESIFGFKTEKGINITKDDKDRILSGYNKFYGNKKELTLTKAYKNTLSEYYSNEIRLSKELGRTAYIPTFRQFSYWADKLSNDIDTKRKRKNRGDFERNQRGLTGSVSSSFNILGSVFEIDATSADVHIVTPLNRNFCIGRPLIYSITDRASRMIVGFYVSLEEASWETARLAIIHAFTSKVEYCKRFGIDILESDWPCKHQPHTIIGDRGEMKGKLPGKVLPSAGVDLDLAPTYRPDMKSIVEGRFKIINEESLHELPGTTKGKFRIRGEIDPRQEAVLTMDEITAILIKDVIKHNNATEFSELLTKDLIKAGLRPTPLNFWNFHIGNHRHKLKCRPIDEVKALLLPPVQAKVTKYGIKYGEVYYHCRLSDDENWYSRARTGKEWKIEARFDENNIEELYIRPDPRKGFVLCRMMPRSNIYKSLHYTDVLYITEWKNFGNSKVNKNIAELDNYEFKKDILKNAYEEQAKHLKPITKSAKITDIRERRKQEKERIKKQERLDISPVAKTDFSFNNENSKHENIFESEIAMFRDLWEESEDD